MRAIGQSLLGSKIGVPGPGLWCLDCVQFGVRREVARSPVAPNPTPIFLRKEPKSNPSAHRSFWPPVITSVLIITSASWVQVGFRHLFAANVSPPLPFWPVSTLPLFPSCLEPCSSPILDWQILALPATNSTWGSSRNLVHPSSPPGHLFFVPCALPWSRNSHLDPCKVAPARRCALIPSSPSAKPHHHFFHTSRR